MPFVKMRENIIFLLCRLEINLFCASGKSACYTTTVNVLLGKRSFGKTKMVVEDGEVSRIFIIT